VSTLAITVVGRDRPGIIARAAEALSDCGMNLEDSSMTLLRGHFAMTLVCAGAADAAQVQQVLDTQLDASLTVTVGEVPPEPEPTAEGSSYLVTVHGADRLGIVARLAGVVAAHGANITDLTTRLAGDLYVLVAEVDLRAGTDVDAFRAELDRVAAELGVDAHLAPVERDDL
jgi:glycine cleavage system transcriptional repressor